MTFKAITVTLGGQEFTGLPLTLDQLEDMAKGDPLSNAALLKLWLADPATEPKLDGAPRAFPHEIQAAALAILDISELKPAEPRPGEG